MENKVLEGKELIEELRKYVFTESGQGLIEEVFKNDGVCLATGNKWTFSTISVHRSFYDPDIQRYVNCIHLQSLGLQPDGEPGIYEMWPRFEYRKGL